MLNHSPQSTTEKIMEDQIRTIPEFAQRLCLARPHHSSKHRKNIYVFPCFSRFSCILKTKPTTLSRNQAWYSYPAKHPKKTAPWPLWQKLTKSQLDALTQCVAAVGPSQCQSLIPHLLRQKSPFQHRARPVETSRPRMAGEIRTTATLLQCFAPRKACSRRCGRGIAEK